MPYDARPVSKGGNRGIDEEFSRTAPQGKFRIVGVDTFDGGDWVYKDVGTLQEAKEFADEKAKGSQMLKVHVYNDRGHHVYEAGKF
jgi:uncharacterized membrane protein YkoI